MLRLICDRTAGTLLSGFDSRRRNVTLAETWRPSEESSLTVQFYGVESDSSGRLEPYDLTASGDKPSLLLGSSTFSATEGALVLSFGGDDSAEIDLDTISATSIAYALNQAPAIGAAGNVNVRELPNDGFGRGFLITFREVGSRSGFTATLKDDAPPLTAALTVVQEGTASLREVLLLTVRGEQFASLTGASWSALSAPTVAITQVTAGSVSAAARYTLSCGTSSTAEPRRWTTRLVFSGGTTTLIGNESSPSDIEQAINTALGSTGAWRVRKTGANTYDLEAQAVGTNTVTVTDSTVSYWPGLTGTLSADTVALAANIAGKSKIEAVATIDTGTGEPLYREYLPVYAALLPDSSTTPMVYARINSTASAPTATDDDSEGYGLFSLWIDTSVPKSYILVDNTTDAAVWQELSDAAADGDVVGPASATDSTVATFDGTTGKLLKASSVTVPATTGTLALTSDITATAVGLGNCDNTSDANKPISTATQTALDAKAPILTTGTTYTGSGPVSSGDVNKFCTVIPSADTTLALPASGTEGDVVVFVIANPSRYRVLIERAGGIDLFYTNGNGFAVVRYTTDWNIAQYAENPTKDKGDLMVAIGSSERKHLTVGSNDTLLMADSAQTTGLKWANAATVKTALSLGNVDNTSDANKPISTATQTALDAKLATAGGTMTGSLVIPDGSVGTATGAIYFANDTDCGIARQGANHIRLFASSNAQFVLQLSGSDALFGWSASPQYRIAATGECYQLMQDFSGSHCGVRLQNAATKYYVRAASSQTANILEIQNSAGTVLAAFNSAGNPVIPTKTPASASDTGTSGQIAWDSDYIYVCTAANTWKRAALSTW